jgi:hypothetical protein
VRAPGLAPGVDRAQVVRALVKQHEPGRPNGEQGRAARQGRHATVGALRKLPGMCGQRGRQCSRHSANWGNCFVAWQESSPKDAAQLKGTAWGSPKNWSATLRPPSPEPAPKTASPGAKPSGAAPAVCTRGEAPGSSAAKPDDGLRGDADARPSAPVASRPTGSPGPAGSAPAKAGNKAGPDVNGVGPTHARAAQSAQQPAVELQAGDNGMMGWFVTCSLRLVR